MATDACGNTATCTQKISIIDNIAPTITCPVAVTVTCLENVPVQNINDVTASDNCTGTVTKSFVGDVTTNNGCNDYYVTRTYMATDACGNTATCTQKISIIDNIAPTITCPVAVTVTCSTHVPQPDTTLVTASDNCLGSVTRSFVSDVKSNETCLNRFTITRTYMATDACGNTATCTQTITVNDNVPPMITCPVADTVACLADVPVANTDGVLASDNCVGTVTKSFVGDVTTNNGCNDYYVTRTYMATDACGKIERGDSI